LKIRSANEYLKYLKESPYYHTKLGAAQLLRKDPEGERVLVNLLKDNTSANEVKKACLIAIQEPMDKETTDIVIKLLNNPDPGFRKIALQMLSNRPDYCDLIKPLLRDNNRNIKIYIVYSIYNNPGKIYPLCLHYLQDKDEGVASQAFISLEPYMDKRAIPHLEKLVITTKNAEIRSRANDMLIKLKSKGHSRGDGKK
jgi:HEAT repeat protein